MLQPGVFALMGIDRVAQGDLGMLVGTFLGGKLFRHLGPSWPFAMFGAPNLGVFLWSLRLRSRLLDETDSTGEAAPTHSYSAAATSSPGAGT